jgi:hypothetical protein
MHLTSQYDNNLYEVFLGSATFAFFYIMVLL